MSSSLVLTGLVASLPAQSASAAVVDPQTIGTSAATAAGSCWEIKQVSPSAPSGAYWLLTPAMTEPQQFFCDQETDGGGWVLIGKGRDGWTDAYDGSGRETDLRGPDLSPMSAATTELPSLRIDQLLNGGKVSALTDGVRLRRATNAAGSSWQESRLKFADRDRWVWTFGAQHNLKSFSFNGSSSSGGVTSSYGTDNAFLRVNNNIQSAQGYHPGFAFGGGVTGTSAAGSYLWSRTDGLGGALPYTQVYLRPKVTTNDSRFVAIPNSGTPLVKGVSVASSFADNVPWHVAGLAGSTGSEGDVEVQAFTQSGSTMYVGGNFRYAQRAAGSTGADRVDQPFLAAFNVNTGELVPGFRPVLNEQVRALATLPNGSVLAAGDFSQANGRPATAIVALNPATGATDTRFSVNVENRLSSGVLKIKSLSVRGGDVYLGGAFTHLSGATGGTVYARSMAQLSASTGAPRTDWNPNFNGTVNAIDAGSEADRVYVAGYFDASNGIRAFRAAALRTSSGAPLADPVWEPTWSTTNKTYQQAIQQVGGHVIVGGSEHSLFTFSTSSFDRLTGNIMFPKGDIQGITESNGVVYAGCHCDHFNYSNSYTWPGLGAGWTQADAIDWFGAYDGGTSATIPNFTPNMSMRLGSGIWAIEADTNGRIWAGGDVVTAATATRASQWSGGFARFSQADATPPSAPGSLTQTSSTSTSTTLSWGASSDNAGSVRYQVLRDDRVIAVTNNRSLTVPKGGNNRFFVRAADNAGNVSASTSVLNLGPSGTAPAASFTATAKRNQVALDASSSTPGSGSISSYAWDFGDGTTGTGAQTSHAYTAAGSYVVNLTVTNSNGLTHTASQVLEVKAPPTNAAPTDTYGRAVYDSEPLFFYRLGEQDGTVARDSGPDALNGTYSGSYTLGRAGALAGNTDTATEFASSGSGLVVDPFSVSNPTTYSQEIWFKTSTTRGGKLIGFGNNSSGLSSNYDRHIYMQDDGRLVFGAYTGNTVTVTTPTAYNDNAWHQVVSSQSPTDGMRLYVDGQLIGTDPNGVAQSYAGYWRIGGDRTWGSSSTHFDGSLDEAAVYEKVLSPAEVTDHYNKGKAQAPSNLPPTASFSSTTSDLTASFDASGSSDPDGTISSYSWSFDDGSSGTGRTTTHDYSAAGTYQVSLTVRDNGGAEKTVTRPVTVTAAPVNAAPTASFTSTTSDLTASVDASDSTDSDGTISSYSWSFGDGSSGTGRTTTHDYSAAGTYQVSLTVTDDKGLKGTTTSPVTVTAPPTGTLEETVVARDAQWNWRYEAGAPAAAWNQRTFDASGWTKGAAPLGFGTSGLGTNIDTFATNSDRPRASYFTRSFQVADRSKVTRLVLNTVANDGVVVYVNGTEVDRHNMRAGEVDYLTYAPSARNAQTADADPVVIEVPTSLLVNGTNVVAAETHVNYRGTRDVEFKLDATLTRTP